MNNTEGMRSVKVTPAVKYLFVNLRMEIRVQVSWQANLGVCLGDGCFRSAQCWQTSSSSV